MSSLSMGILIFLLSREVERQKGRDGEQKFLLSGTECTYGGLFFDSSINYETHTLIKWFWMRLIWEQFSGKLGTVGNSPMC